ncbi:anosmin-1a [Neolamprologus brichardi]|uniref:anosmin-1a n=1 Tax=Neolamprologus brichardi TaxID=32507 RepID=UPI001643C0A1|nr:anosmin-1a [Neolamprologus brichardi]
MLTTNSGVRTSLWIIFLCSSGVCARRQHDADESWSETVSRARCASRCLSLHSVAALSILQSRLQNNGSLGWCRDHKQCAKTTEQRARLSDVRPGRWYQFRVAAVNLHGTRGFTTPSRHFHSSRDPSNPPAPTELRVANMSFGPGSTVAARIEWSVPPDLDVPVHHYKVSWSWTAVGHSSASSLTKRRKTVRKSQVELDSMRTNRSYSVEVQAVSHWGQTQFKGPRAVLRFTTQQSTSAPRSPAGDVLDVGTPFYQDGQLRVHVYWQRSVDPLVEFYRVQWGPESCGHNQTSPVQKTSTKESFISLQGLLFSCKYKVLLQPVSKTSRPLAESTSFHTPPCTAIQAKSPTPVNCPRETAVNLQKVLMKPTNLIASFEVLGGNVTAIFSWDISMTSSHQQLTGYQVTWAEVISTNRNYNVKLPRTLISQSQILPPDGNVLVVSGLRPASLYRLEVQAITTEGEGPTTRRTFQTPGYQSTLLHRSRLRKHPEQPITDRH